MMHSIVCEDIPASFKTVIVSNRLSIFIMIYFLHRRIIIWIKKVKKCSRKF